METYYTSDFFITINTNQTYSVDLEHALREAIHGLNDTEAVEEELIDDRVVVSEVDAAMVGVERGKKLHRLHAHFVWHLDHSTNELKLNGLNQRLQDFFASRLSLPNVYVSADLLWKQSAAANYNRKQQQQASDEGTAGRLLASRTILDRRIER